MIHHLRFRKHHMAIALSGLAFSGMVLSVSWSGLFPPPSNFGGVPVALAATAAGQPTYEMFLKMDGIEGSATDDKHRAQIVVDSYAWKVARAVSGKQAGFDSFVVTMPASKASPDLFLTTAAGLKVAKAVLAVRKSGGAEDFLKWTLTDVRITSLQTVGNTHGDGVQDQLTLSVGKVEMEYREPLPNGSFGPVLKKGWDIRTGSAVQY